MEEKVCGDGPSSEVHYITDPDLAEVHETIEMIVHHGFDACRKYVDSLDFVRLFCVENDKFDISKLADVEGILHFQISALIGLSSLTNLFFHSQM